MWFKIITTRGYLARDFKFFGVRTKYLAHIGAKKFEFMGTICLKSLIEHYLKKESFKICFFPFEITQLKKINKYINIKLKKIGGNMGQKLCWDHWKNINSGKIDSSSYETLTKPILQFVAGEHGYFGGHESEDIRTIFSTCFL